jgi:hypothetical protein
MFPIIRYVLDLVWCLLPFASIYILIPLLIFAFINNFIRHKVQLRFQNIKKITTRFLLLFVKYSCLTICVFYCFWGFHYLAPNPALKMNLTIKSISKAALLEELLLTKDSLIQTYNSKINSNTLNINKLKQETFTFCKKNLNPNLQYHINQSVLVSVRQIYPKGWLSGFGASGIYNPFTGECNLDAGLHPIQKPYTIAHELTHACGITDEGFCNFVAYLVCTGSKNIDSRYSGFLMYWRTVGAEYKAIDPEAYKFLRASLPPKIIADLDNINATMLAMPNFISNHTQIYDAFLKSQGQQEGVESYNKVIGLVRAYRKK